MGVHPGLQWVWPLGWASGRGEPSHTRPHSSLPSRIREQLQSAQAQWAGVRERSAQRTRRLRASLRLQVRGQPGAGGPQEQCLSPLLLCQLCAVWGPVRFTAHLPTPAVTLTAPLVRQAS